MPAESIGSLLLPHALDRIAADDGDFHYAEYPRSRDFSQGFDTVTFKQLANAVNGIAHCLERSLGRSQNAEVVAFLAPNSPYTTAAFVAFMKAGFEIFMISERNSVPAQLHLFEKVSCRVLVTTDRTFPPVKDIIDADPSITLVELPPWASMITHAHAAYPFSKDLTANREDICFVVHTSGTTGFPKPVKLSYDSVGRIARCLTITSPKGYKALYSFLAGKKGVDLLPLSHPAGISIGILNAIYNKFTVILPPQGLPPTAQTLSDLLDCASADWAAVAPLTLETLSKDPLLTQNVVGRIEQILYSGGGLPKVFGDILSDKVQLLSGLGSSETGPIPIIYRDDFDWVKDWNYLEFHPACNAYLDPRPGNVSELVLKRSEESLPFQPAFVNNSLEEFRTRDLFISHPTIPGLWTHASRSDDVIVLLNAEKVSPSTFESIVATHPKVSGALMFGSQRFEVGLLVELQGQSELSPAQRAVMLDEIWPTINQANSMLPDHARLARSHVLFTSPGEPIMRTLKGSVRRQPTLDLYEPRIDRLYADAEQMWSLKQNRQRLNGQELLDSVTAFLHAQPRFSSMQRNDDFFRAGMDSLQVIRLVRHLKEVTELGDLDPSIVYRASTIDNLSVEVSGVIAQRSTTQIQREKERLDRICNLQQTLRTQIQNFLTPPSYPAATQSSQQSDVPSVLLTGSTGYIGRYVLETLLTHPSVSHVYALNRSAESEALQMSRNAATDASLPTKFDSRKVTFLTAELEDSQSLGLNPQQYSKVCRDVTHIIHLAWPVDFNKPLESYTGALQGLINLTSLSAKSPKKPHLTFISSVASTMTSHGQVPEAFQDNPSICPAVGYAESKWLGEWLVHEASHLLPNFQLSIIRLGVICGPSQSPGKWSLTDWIPAMILSSAYLNALPSSLSARPDTHADDIRWMPVDTAAEVIIDILLAQKSDEQGTGCGVYQPLNINLSTWPELLPAIKEMAEKHPLSSARGKSVEIVSPQEWVLKLRSSAAGAGMGDEELARMLKINPAVKLQGHFEEIFGAGASGSRQSDDVTWDSEKAALASRVLRKTPAVTGDDLRRWMQHWFEDTLRE